MPDPIVLSAFLKEEPLENMGGCRAFGLAYAEWISELPAPVHGVVVEDTQYNGDTPPIGFIFTEDSGDYTEGEKMGDSGPEWTTEFSCFYPGDSIDVRQKLAAIARHGLVIEVPDNNDNTRRVGTVENPCTMSYKYGTGGAARELNGYDVRFRWLSDEAAPLIDNTYAPADHDAHLIPQSTSD